MNIKKTFLACAAAAAISALSVFPSFASGWQQDEQGYWYEREDSTYPAGSWEQIGGVWYLFDQSGYMLTGWQQVDNDWFYLEDSGAMVSDTTRDIDGKSYTFGGNGAMAEPSAGITPGRFEGRTFINDWSNIKLTVPDGFMISGPEYLSDLKNKGYNVDMAAVKSDDCGIIVMYLESDIKWEDYIETFSQMRSLSDEGQAAGIENVQIGGEQYLKVHMTEETDGFDGDTYSKGGDGYIAAIAFIYNSGNQSDVAPAISSLTAAH